MAMYASCGVAEEHYNMAQQMIIRFQKENPSMVQCWTSDLTASDAVPNVMSLKEAAALNGEAVVLVPAEEVLLTEANVPKASRTRLRQVIPYALEEHLVDDVDTLHFALAEAVAEPPLPVAVVSDEKMAYWKAQLREAGIYASVIMPESIALPIDVDTWNLVIEEKQAWLQTGRYQGFSVEPDNIVLGVQLAIGKAVVAAAGSVAGKANEETAATALGMPKTLRVFSSAPLPDALATQLTALLVPQGIALTQQTSPHWLAEVATATMPPAINLLQGEYTVKRKRAKGLRTWYRVGYLLGAWVILKFVLMGVELVYWQQKDKALQAELDTTYETIFPAMVRTVNAKVMVEREWERLLAGAGQGEFLGLLGMMAQGLMKSAGIEIRSISFRGDQLTLLVEALGFTQLENFTENLKEVGLTVRQDSATSRGDRVDGRLIISQG